MNVKALLKRWFPNAYSTAKNAAGTLFLAEINQLILRDVGGYVATGPFAGMRYIDRARGSVLAPKLLGTYEKELHAVIAKIISRPYDRVIDVGCAEGYYAIGLALKLPQTLINVYDVDADALALLHRLAKLNGVEDQIVMGSLCNFTELNRYRHERCLVICDIEGGEYDLIRPDSADSLRHFDILVEIHDGPASSRIHDALAVRFRSSHAVQFIKHVPRRESDFPIRSSLFRQKSRLLALDEMRTYGIEWAFFEALRSSPPSGQR